MALWAGIDEAGYGPLLGPLVVAGTVFQVPETPREGALWPLLKDAVSRRFKAADGRLVVDDSKRVYSRARGIRPLEESVLSFLAVLGVQPSTAGELFAAAFGPDSRAEDGAPWWQGVSALPLPRRSNAAALASKTADLAKALHRTSTGLLAVRAAVVLPGEFNRHVAYTCNKASLLFQRCGMLLQAMWDVAGTETLYVLVDRHGGRMHYRKLLTDAFPGCACNILRESDAASVYRISDGPRAMVVGFKPEADRCALPVALASMTAKYIRELYMEAFNAYWLGRMEGLRPTAGYAKDARRFLQDIASLIEDGRVDLTALIRDR